MMKNGDRNRLAVWGLCLVAFGFCPGLPEARGAAPSEFAGTWLNITPKTAGITKVEIGIVRSNFTIHAWQRCTPTACDLGTITTPIPFPLGETFPVVYELPAVTTTLRITLIGPNSLYIHTRVDSEGSRQDYDDYFYREGGSRAPDLVVSGLSIPKPVVVYGAVPRTDVALTIQNIGPGILPAGTVQAALSGCTRNGEPLVSSGYFAIAVAAPLYPGQTATHSFAVGHDSGWEIGCYSIRFMVDSNEAITEADERNNLSSVLSFDVAEERFLSGTIEYGGQPLTNYTQVPATSVWIRDELTNQALYGYFFWYNTQTGHYLFSGLPNHALYLSMRFHIAGVTEYLGGNFVCGDYVDPSTLTDAEAGTHDIPAWKILHLLEPQDNGRPLEGSDARWQCAGTRFAWEPLPTAVKYKIAIDTYRDAAHPSGYGFVANTLYLETAELSFTPDLPVLPQQLHYRMDVEGYNAANMPLGYYGYSFFVPGSSGYGFGPYYSFKICATCSRADLNRDCEVSLPDFAILAEEWLTNTK
jgi:hypothetical protein